MEKIYLARLDISVDDIDFNLYALITESQKKILAKVLAKTPGKKALVYFGTNQYQEYFVEQVFTKIRYFDVINNEMLDVLKEALDETNVSFYDVVSHFLDEDQLLAFDKASIFAAENQRTKLSEWFTDEFVDDIFNTAKEYDYALDGLLHGAVLDNFVDCLRNLLEYSYAVNKDYCMLSNGATCQVETLEQFVSWLQKEKILILN